MLNKNLHVYCIFLWKSEFCSFRDFLIADLNSELLLPIPGLINYGNSNELNKYCFCNLSLPQKSTQNTLSRDIAVRENTTCQKEVFTHIYRFKNI